MVALFIAALFPLALTAALGTIILMLSTHGAKMLAALRMEHVPSAGVREVPEYRGRGYNAFRSNGTRPLPAKIPPLPRIA